MQQIKILKSSDCGATMSRCDELHRQEVYNSLEYERLTRKYGDIIKILDGDGRSNWAQTFYLLFLRSLGDENNREAFMEVARRLPMSILIREQDSVEKVEAMLIGVSGFIDNYPNTEYIAALKLEAKYLLHKYQIRPLDINFWNLGHVRPFNHPVVRLSQVATLICSHKLLFGDIIQCQTRYDVDSLFTINATKHLFDTHPQFCREGQKSIAIGAVKRNLLGINLVVPIQYAYGCFLHDDELCARAQDLNESLPAESNRYIKDWRKYGIKPKCAFESQALIQLTTCYCHLTRCHECPVGKRITKGVLIG